MTEKESRQPFFIFGCGRSGTSLLSRMLNQNSRLAVPYESHLFNTFLPILKYYGNLEEKKNRDNLISDILLTDVMNDWEPKLSVNEISKKIRQNNFGGIFEAILISWTEKNNKKRWGEKTPHHIDYWNEITKIWPEAKVIHIYRDGRDVALSLKSARFGPKTIYANAKYWSNYLGRVGKLKKQINPQNLLELSYENLLENTESELQRICEFLNEDYEISMLEFYKNKNDYKTDQQNQSNLKKPIIKSNSNKWRKKMNAKEIRVFESIAGDYLKEYGYEVVNIDSQISFIDDFYLGKIISPTKKILAMIKNRKGHKDSLIKLFIKLRLKLSLR